MRVLVSYSLEDGRCQDCNEKSNKIYTIKIGESLEVRLCYKHIIELRAKIKKLL